MWAIWVVMAVGVMLLVVSVGLLVIRWAERRDLEEIGSYVIRDRRWPPDSPNDLE